MDKKNKILIVDDDHFLLNMYALKFKSSGFDVNTANEGTDALRKLKEGLVPDVVMLDMVMPGMDGLEILAQIRKENLVPKAHVIILSNQSQSSDIEQAKKLGISGYIVKATTIPSEVVTEVEHLLEGKPLTKDSSA